MTDVQAGSRTGPKVNGWLALVVLVALAVGMVWTVRALSGGGGDDAAVSRSDFGDDWPLTVENGTLACDDGAVTFTANGTTYAVNGLAETLGRAQKIDPIWQDNEALGEGFKKNIGPLLDRGLGMCEE